MTRDPNRPADHPLVELAHDLVDGFGRAFSEFGAPGEREMQRHQQLRRALHSARRLVDDLELIVDELEMQSQSPATSPPHEDATSDDDYQIISISTV
jgi:hypothetical protein